MYEHVEYTHFFAKCVYVLYDFFDCNKYCNARGVVLTSKSVYMILPQEFPDKQELHRNMLGLLGNVAEVKALRPQLLTPQFITVFR